MPAFSIYPGFRTFASWKTGHNKNGNVLKKTHFIRKICWRYPEHILQLQGASEKKIKIQTTM